ncbi:MAG: bifunctional (p)ppGpp synthetase/guanosine-3',5'-bis(diphosphate) 3'-pyrophosphohydrolase [Lachnospiraceae bacterium]|jgi:GTP pyrophosphokinase|nr:bifunctional (p)ppGpp synthetase/guanosine-3',5'-bis(diphosphate) 3'-pyrophosphohydrolase [Lachnospiraceae bacterium]
MSLEDTKKELMDFTFGNSSLFDDYSVAAEMIDGHAVKNQDDYENPEFLYNKLITAIKAYHPSSDFSIIEKAYNIAKEAHGEQKRKSGEPYIIHPLWVSIILAGLGMDKETIVAGMLHDVVEDTTYSYEDIVSIFDAEIADLVDGVTKLGSLSYSTDKLDVQAENLRKMFFSMAKDIRVIIIKLADRLHNMRTLEFMPRNKQIEKSKETMDIYAPIAGRLGISKIKMQLDDLAFKYYQPEIFAELVNQINEKFSMREEFINARADEIRQLMESTGIEAEVYGRFKHFFSIYKKMVNQNKTLDEIYDLFAIRIIVGNIGDCYAALGYVHDKYTVIQGRIKDYISMPKANGYQSLHTTVIGSGEPFEIQVRTMEMQRTAEYGVAAHWKYKAGKDNVKGEGEVGAETKLNWLRQILELQQDVSDNQEYLGYLKGDLDLFGEDVYVYTPNGDVKTLPKGSTPIDFAYSIHSAVGNKMIGARVNNAHVKLDYVLKTGDRVEVITSGNSHGPSRDWINVVKSSQAKNKINQWFKKQGKEENIIRGKELISSYAKSKNIQLSKIVIPRYQEIAQKKFGFRDWDSVLAAIGHGGVKEGQVVNRLLEEYNKEHQEPATDSSAFEELKEIARKEPKTYKSQNGILVKGIDDMDVRLSKCCNPVPGDDIVGFVTRGRGLSIHRTDCPNILNLSEIERARLQEVEWAPDAEGNENREYVVELRIYAYDRTGLMLDFNRITTEQKLDIIKLNSNKSKEGTYTIEVGFAIKKREDLEVLISKYRQIEGIIEVKRTIS